MLTNYLERVKEYVGIRPQYDSDTCQSACCASALGLTDIAGVRQTLLRIGARIGSDAGAPTVMAEYLGKQLGSRYELNLDASLNDCKEYLKNGEVLITHGFWTGNGHVIIVKGLEDDPQKLSYRFAVGDPWGEFDAKNWRYLNVADRFEGYYSSRAVYAAIIASQNRWQAAECYRRGELDSNRGGAWVHRIKP
jgi:hypothetical protein